MNAQLNPYQSQQQLNNLVMDQTINGGMLDGCLINTIGHGLLNASPIQVRQAANVLQTRSQMRAS